MTKEYELIPKKEVEELRKEIQELKSYLHTGNGEEGETLLSTIKELTSVFKEAVTELKKGGGESGRLGGDVKMDTLLNQNEKIARGILALADMVQENLPKLTKAMSQQPRIRYIRIPTSPRNPPQYPPQYSQLRPQQRPQPQPQRYPPPPTAPPQQQVIPQPPQNYGNIPKLNPKEIPRHDMKF